MVLFYSEKRKPVDSKRGGIYVLVIMGLVVSSLGLFWAFYKLNSDAAGPHPSDSSTPLLNMLLVVVVFAGLIGIITFGAEAFIY